MEKKKSNKPMWPWVPAWDPTLHNTKSPAKWVVIFWFVYALFQLLALVIQLCFHSTFLSILALIFFIWSLGYFQVRLQEYKTSCDTGGK